MTREFKKGDKVVWSSHGRNDTPGTVERKITADTYAAGRNVKASKDDAQYLVKSEKGGGEAVHKPKALRKRLAAGIRPTRPQSSARASRLAR